MSFIQGNITHGLGEHSGSEAVEDHSGGICHKSEFYRALEEATEGGAGVAWVASRLSVGLCGLAQVMVSQWFVSWSSAWGSARGRVWYSKLPGFPYKAGRSCFLEGKLAKADGWIVIGWCQISLTGVSPKCRLT